MRQFNCLYIGKYIYIYIYILHSYFSVFVLKKFPNSLLLFYYYLCVSIQFRHSLPLQIVVAIMILDNINMLQLFNLPVESFCLEICFTLISNSIFNSYSISV